MKSEYVIISEKKIPSGKLGVLTLNRPKLINALNITMCEVLNMQLKKWEEDPVIKAVLILGEGEKGFCAGGDVRAIYEIGREDPLEAMHFFSEEYQLNRHIYHFPKPYISFVHGICMGGGLGVSTHASHRVASDNLRMAMPETKIGFYPDVGATFFLSRLPGEIGMYLGLTGEEIDAQSALYAGLIDHIIPKKSFDKVIEALCALEAWDDTQVHQSLEKFSEKIKKSDLSKKREIIDDCFKGHTLEDLLSDLDKHHDVWSMTVLQSILSRAPTSVKITFEALRRAKRMEFNECMAMEYRITEQLVQQHDFYEGVRAAIIDKDNKPIWNPNTLDDVNGYGWT